MPEQLLNSGDQFRDRMAALLRTKYDNVRAEVQLTAKRADICFEISVGPRRTISVAAECKNWGRALTRNDVKNIIDEYNAAFLKKEMQELWIVCDRVPASGARDYVEAYSHCQIMTGLECEQNIVDFQPLLRYLAADFSKDRISQYFIPPSFDSSAETKSDLHTYISEWLSDNIAKPVAIWGGYGMGKTSYARFLAAELAKKCLEDYGSRIPILLNLGDFTTAPNLESLIFTQLTNFYGVRYLSSIAFRILNEQQRFVLILDGFDEMKFAMAPNEFNYISSEIRRLAAVNSKLILLGRPGAIETEEEEKRLTTAKLNVQDFTLRADDAPDFSSLRMSFLSKEQYLLLIRKFLDHATDRRGQTKTVNSIIDDIEKLDLGNILARPVQAKMLAEVVADPSADVSSVSRFALYDMFIKRILRREEEKAARKHIGTAVRTNFMRLLAWWLWTDKKTRTFAANEIPMDIIQRFEVPGVPIEGLRRELLIGSIIEEKNIGQFLSEKTAGVFYFPHTSFTEFLVADYIMSSDFLSIDVAKLPHALYGEVPTFLNEHPQKQAIRAVYDRMKSAKIAMNTGCISVLLNDFSIRMYIELVSVKSTDPWDICLHYFFLHAQGTALRAREFALSCLMSENQSAQLAAMYCLMYETQLAPVGQSSAIARMVVHILREFGINGLISVSERGWTSAKSSDLNYLGAIITSCIKVVSRDASVTFDFAEFTTVALSFIGASCAVSDVVENMRKTYGIPGNDLLTLAENLDERTALGELLRKGGDFRIVPTL